VKAVHPPHSKAAFHMGLQ